MRHERVELPADAALAKALSVSAVEADRSGAFPQAAFEILKAHALVGVPPLEDERIGDLLRLLATVGRGDLNVGRIYEGHVNAMLLVRAHGTTQQRERWEAVARRGGLFGVWNTDLPADPLRIERGIFQGSKAFASGVDGLSHAIVTVSPTEGRRMVIVPVERLVVDRTWWKPMGMRASGSHVAAFDGVAVDADWMLGAPDSYVREPWFSGGAIRFAAVQTGGMHAVFDVALQHLLKTGRDGDPYQRQRIARMAIAVETAYAFLDRAADRWVEAAREPDGGAGDRLIAAANATRSVVEMSAMSLLEEAERAVGAAGFNAPHPLERLVRDLRTYLRQPNPDGALSSVGAAIADGRWTPGEPLRR
ncbi:MAG: acyl-CoA dehydrogenase [Rhizobiaceae bacterium]|nr:acyl-CoA dehydrogenase [Rhizobiaceae bacterium]